MSDVGIRALERLDHLLDQRCGYKVGVNQVMDSAGLCRHGHFQDITNATC